MSYKNLAFFDLDGVVANLALWVSETVNVLLRGQDYRGLSDSKTIRKCLRDLRKLGVTSTTPSDFSWSSLHIPESASDEEKKALKKRFRPYRSIVYKIAGQKGFFKELPVMNRWLLDVALSKHPHLCFLTSPIGNHHFSEDGSLVLDEKGQRCAEEKRWWVKNVLGLDNEVIVVPREMKAEIVGQGWLIDDHPKTWREFNAAGKKCYLFPDQTQDVLIRECGYTEAEAYAVLANSHPSSQESTDISQFAR